MTIKDFVEKKIVIAFTSPEQLEEFRKMCVNHDLRMAVSRRPVSTVPLKNLFVLPVCNPTKALHLVYDFNNSDGVTFEQFKNDKPYKIIIECDGNDLTTAKMIINGKTIKETWAKRMPEDKFDFKVASTVAFSKLFETREKVYETCDECVHFAENEKYCENINCKHAFVASKNKDKPSRFVKRNW